MQKIQNGNTVGVNYTGRLEDGTVFDSSMVEGREPLKVTLGQGQLIPGFEKALIDMTVGEQKTIEIEVEDAYGPVIEEMIIEVDKNQVPENIEVGQMLQGQGPMGPVNVKVVEVKEETVRIDGNHPLAGKKLIFDLEVTEIN